MIQRYEILRLNSGLQGGDNQERNLLVQRGMMAWIKARTACTPLAQLSPSAPISVGASIEEKVYLQNLLPRGLEAPLVSLLAGMTLEACKGMTP